MESREVTDGEYGIQEAITWGSDFKWPQDIGKRDSSRALEASYELEDMIRRHRRVNGKKRLCVERVNRLVNKEDEDYERLISLSGGMIVFTDEMFIPNNKPPPLRSLYTTVCNAVNKVLVELWKEELVFILPKSITPKFGTVHYTSLHWTKKKMKESGRYLFDARDDKYGSALNSDKAREKLEEYYGPINHPTINDLIIMIQEFVKIKIEELGDKFNYNDILIWKGDLSKAFTLLDFSIESCKKLVCRLTNDLDMVYHTGMFGWTGTPFCFQVITRTITKLVKEKIKGSFSMYVDDGMGVCMASEINHDMDIFRSISIQLLGDHAIAEDKWEIGRRLDWIGWSINLDTQQVTLARKNFMKTFYGFYTCNEYDTIKIEDIEKMASWASRYTLILRIMKPFTNSLYSELIGIKNRRISKKLKKAAIESIQMWRIVLCLLKYNDLEYARKFSSFDNKQADILMCYDASLEGIGVSIYDITNQEMKLLLIGSYEFSFNLQHQAKYQNIVEFIAVIAGLLMLAKLKLKHKNIKLKGDSVTSLTWSMLERYRSVEGRRSALVFTLLAIAFDLDVVEVEHIPGADNTLHDELSRGVKPSDLGYKEDNIMNFSSLPYSNILELCDPASTEYELTELWKIIAIHINQV
jgi:hypothetical protein